MISSLRRGSLAKRKNYVRSILISAFGFMLFAILFGNQSAFAIPTAASSAEWVNETTIKVGDSNFTRSTNGPNQWVFTFVDTYQPPGSLTLPPPPINCTSTLTFIVDPYSSGGGQQARRSISTVNNVTKAGCTTPITGSISVANSSAVNGNTTPETPEAGTATGATESPEEQSCNRDWNPLKWVICPIVIGAHNAVRELDNWINQLMTVDTSAIFDRANNESAENYYKVWASFRNLALGIVVIAALIMVISTAFGFEILDAYTIRKTLPRVGLALLLIVLSWPILEFLITLVNDIGNGLRSLIYSPFKAEMETYVLGNGALFITNLFFAGTLLSLGFLGLLSFGLTAFLAIVIAFLVLVIREMLIILLVILAPLGIAGLVLPNTQKLWQLWQNTLTTLLLAFPIIAAFIALGRVFSVVAYSSAQGADDVSKAVNEIIAFLAYFIPYFLLPFAFKLAGGVMATIGGIANNSERGAFDRLKKYRQGKTAENMAGVKTGTRFSQGGKIQSVTGLNAIKRGLNRTGEAATTRGILPGRRREALDQKRRTAVADIMKSPKFQAIKDDDDALMAATYTNDLEASRELTKRYVAGGMKQSDAAAKAGRAVNAVKASTGFGRPQAIAAAQAMVETGTAYSDLDDMTSALARASGGSKSTAAALGGFANAFAKQKGRHDWAPGAGAVISDINDKMDGKALTIPRFKQNQDAWESGSLYQVTNGKAGAMKNFSKHILDSARSADTGRKMDAAIALTELQHALPSASGANQQIIIQTLKDAGINYRAATTVDEQIVAATRAAGVAHTDADFREIQRKARIYDRDAQTQQQLNTP